VSTVEPDRAYFAAMSTDSPPTTPLRHMLWLAWLLSAAYLAAGTGVALVHRLSHGLWWGEAAQAMDLCGGGFLRIVHLWHPLLLQMQAGHLGPIAFRAVLIGVSVAIIFSYALTVGLLLNGARSLWMRRATR
jgi:hypothetical protein